MLNLNILEYLIIFKFEKIDKLLWFDNFEVDEEWEVIKINANRNATKTYRGKKPFNHPGVNYDIAIYNKTKWYCLNTYENTGSVVRIGKPEIEIPGLKISNVEYRPHVCYLKFNFDKQIFLTIIDQHEEYISLETNTPDFKTLYYDGMKLELYNSLIRYKGDEYERFYNKFKNIDEEYEFIEKRILKIYNILDIKVDYKSYESMSVMTWYKAKRENQKEWPEISLTPIKNSIEFPKNSGVYYYYTDGYVCLSRRYDDNPELYIPKICKTDHSKNKNSILYKYVNNIEIKHPTTVTNSIINRYSVNKQLKNKVEPEMKIKELLFNGEVYQTDINPEFIAFNGYVLKKIKTKTKELDFIPDAQILDKNYNRICIIKNNEIINSPGNRIKNIITLPWYYKQIIHDYNKVGRLRKGPLMDLTHIGIVNEYGEDFITFPDIEDLYVSTCLQTHRLMTFKNYINVKITYQGLNKRTK